MRSFEYVSRTDAKQAVSLLSASWGQSEILAGGTDLLALMKEDVITPKRVVNIKEIKDLRGVSAASNGFRIGALMLLADLAENLSVRQNYPAFAEALQEAASPQIRNTATLGGNLCQRPRCWYFRNGFGLLPKDESGKDLVAPGENRYHAILGNQGPAQFVSPSTIVPVLIVYGAQVHIEGPQGKRALALEKFYVIPKVEGEHEHDLRPNEIVTAVTLPHAGSAKIARYEIRQKAAFDWPLAVAAVALTTNGNSVQSARIVMGHVAPIPWLSPEAEKALSGKSVSGETARAAAEAALEKANPLSQNAYKVQRAPVAVRRAIVKAGGVA